MAGLRRMAQEAPGRHSRLLERMEAGEGITAEIDLVMLEDAARWTPEWTEAKATAESVVATGEWFVRVFSTVEPRIQVGEPLISDVRVVLPFWFGEAAEPPLDALGIDSYLQPSDEMVKQFVGKNVLIIAAPRTNGSWCRTMGIFLADHLFAQVMEEGLRRSAGGGC